MMTENGRMDSVREEQENHSVIETLTCSEPTATQQQTKGNILSLCRPFLGITLAISSALTVVLVNLFAKLCLVLPPFEIGIIRFIVHLPIIIPPIIYYNDRIVYPPKVTALLVLRGCLGATSMLARLYAVQNMPLGDCTVLQFTSPIFVAIFARIFLKERLHYIYYVFIAICLAGVVLIARPTFIFGHPDAVPEYENILIPSLVALFSSIAAGACIVNIRTLVGTYKIPSNVILFYAGIVGLVYGVIGAYIDRGFQFPFCRSLDYLYASCVGIFAYITQTLLNQALKYSKAFIISLARTSGILFGFVFQILIYSLVPTTLSIGGASMIATSNIAIFIFKLISYKKRLGEVQQYEGIGKSDTGHGNQYTMQSSHQT